MAETPRDRTTTSRRTGRAEPHLLAAELNRAEGPARVAAFQRLPDDRARKVFGLLEPVNQIDILGALEEEPRRRLLDDMEPDDRARMIGRLPENRGRLLLDALAPDERETTAFLLQHPPNSAGRIMSPEVVRLRPAMSVAEALAAVRAGKARAETVYFLPVTDAEGRLLGAVDLAALVLARPDETVSEIATHDAPAVRVSDDQEDVARLMKAGDLMVLPVVDDADRLAGVITFDDAMEVLEFEEGEDIARTGGAEPIDRPYLSVSILRLVRSRIIWLSVLALAAILTVNVLSAFEATLDSVVSLALFIPLLIGIGGNTGAQSATTIVRALAVQDVQSRDALRVALREISTGFIMGLALAAAAFLMVSLFFGGGIALVVAVTLVAICSLAALVGSLMPIIARRLKIDPAVFSAPFVTTIVDTSGLLVYFTTATIVLDL